MRHMDDKRPVNRIFPVLLILILALPVYRCTFRSPATPVWDVDVFVPLLDKLYTMEDLSDETDLVETVGDDVVLNVERDLQTFEIGDQLRVSGAREREKTVPFGELERDYVEFPSDSIVLTEAVIRQGRVTVTLDNDNAFPVDVVFILEDLYGADGQPFRVTRTVPAHTVETPEWPLDGYVFRPPVGDNGINRTWFSGSLTASGSGDIRMVVGISQLYFQSVTGYLKEVTIALNESESSLDIPQEYAGLAVNQASILMTLYGLPFEMQVDLLIEALESLNRGYSTALHIQETIPASRGEGGYTFVLPPDQVTSFINSMPTRIRISGAITVSDSVNAITVYDTTAIRGMLTIRAPLVLSMQAIQNNSDIETIEMDENDRQDVADIRKRFNSGGLSAEVVNALPIGVQSMQLLFAADSNRIFTAPDLRFTLEFPAGDVVGNPGEVSEPRLTRNELSLTSGDLLLFETNPEVYYATRFIFSGTGGMVRVRPRDYIRITASISASVHADLSDDNGEGGGQ